MLSYGTTALIAVIGAAVAGFICFQLGISHRRKTAEAKIGSAEDEAKRLINDAIKTAEQKRKEALLEAKDEIFRLKAESDKELKERRGEISRQERRLTQKEENLDKKTENLEQKEAEAKQKQELIAARLAEVEQIKQREIEKLEVISGLSTEAARTMILERLDDQLSHEKALKINHYENELKENSEELARDLLSQVIARCAADHAQEAVVSVVPLPSDEMKGRIIGREGRNIRALETATGVDVIIDDTPEAITLSSFDPVRREVARQTLEKLIADGRIHPARIEEMVEKARRDVDLTIKKEGEKAVMDAGVHGLHPELVKLIGRLKYRTSYGQNVLKHSLEVCYLSGLIAGELGMDVTLAKRAGLLHDIGKGLDHEYEGTHVSIGVEIAKKYRESAAVIHAIQAHHGDIEAKTPLAFVVMAADAISAARPGARRENLENYIKRLEKLEEISNSFNGVEKSFAIQAGREVRIMVKPEVVDDDNLTILARDIVAKIESELDYPGQIKVNVIRENRAVDFAK
ncbi:MAG: ribonuclease Y [Ruminococcaceae bacterium]|nr:ribonuclease Y [Oscillospiraceae bacterium]